MSLIGSIINRTSTGALLVEDASDSVGYWNAGTPMKANRFAIDSQAVAADDIFFAGLRYAATGRIKVDAVAAIANYNAGLPQTTSGALAVATSGAVASRTTSGIPITSTGRVLTGTTVNPVLGGFSNGFSNGFNI